MKRTEYPEFQFEWQWIKDKTIELVGNSDSGIITIYDEEGYTVAMYAYEMITNSEE